MFNKIAKSLSALLALPNVSYWNIQGLNPPPLTINVYIYKKKEVKQNECTIAIR